MENKGNKNERAPIVWFLRADGEDMPTEEGARLPRTGAQAEYLSKNGYKVVWWKSTFLHGEKRYYRDGYCKLTVNDNETLILLHSKTIYKKNISIKRIVYYYILAKQFEKYSKKEEKPDLIVASYPSILFANAAIKYGKKNNIPVILDVRDYWPDIFLRGFSPKLYFLINPVVKLLKVFVSSIFKNAYGIIAVNDDALLWACNYANREPSDNDKTIYIGCNEANTRLTDDSIGWLKRNNINRDDWNICFFGSLRKTGMDLETCIKSVNELNEKYKDIILVVGGDGDNKEELEKIASIDAVKFPGWLNNDEMNAIMSVSKIGLYCLENTIDFKNTISNKAIQFLSAGLPILTSLEGFSKTLFENNKIGLHYIEGSIEDCSKKIEYLYLNDKELNESSINSKKLFKDQFDLTVTNNSFMKYVELILHKFYNNVL